MTWAPAERSDRIIAALWAGASVAAIAAVPYLVTIASWLPPCPIRRWTGIPCLSCGGTRSVLALARGELWDAFNFNPLVATGSFALVAGGLVAPLWFALGGLAPSLTTLSPRTRIAVAVVLAASWLVVAL